MSTQSLPLTAKPAPIGEETGRVPGKDENLRLAISNYSEVEIGDLVAEFCTEDPTFRKLVEGLLVFASTEGHFSDLFPVLNAIQNSPE